MVRCPVRGLEPWGDSSAFSVFEEPKLGLVEIIQSCYCSDLHSTYQLKDEPDNRIVECAMVGQAQWIVSGDRHLLSFKQHADCAIITLADFVAKP
jgi:predicted nucleic acid-binding protein